MPIRLPATNRRSHAAEDYQRPVLRLAEYSLLFSVFMFGWMKYPLVVGGLDALPMDLLLMLTGALWLIAIIARETDFRATAGFWLLGLYFAAMAASLIASQDFQRSIFKLLTQAYLLALPVLAFNLVRTVAQIRRVALWWLAGSFGVSLLGAATLVLFPFLGPDSLLAWPLHGFGTLPAGPYPRLELTFTYPALLANYLGISLMFLLIGDRLGWFSRQLSIPLGTAILASAFFALTPGFAGIVFMLGVWFWYVAPDRGSLFARAALTVGCVMPALAVVVAAISPTIYDTAPYLVEVPLLGVTVAPSARLLVWTEAARNFLATPILGHGIGVDAATVLYEVQSCSEGCITDAHNTFLNIAAQCGIVGLTALIAVMCLVVCRLRGALAGSTSDVIVFGLSVAWISAFVVQGLVGSFEDARHLWLLLGIILSAETMRRAGPQASPSSNGPVRSISGRD